MQDERWFLCPICDGKGFDGRFQESEIAAHMKLEFQITGIRAEPVLIVGDICMSENIINIQEDNEWCWRQER